MESFWKAPNIYDVIGIVGLAFTLGSIWYAWRLAGRDLKRQIDQAEERVRRESRESYDRLALSQVQHDASEMKANLERADSAIQEKNWPRASDYLSAALTRATRLLAGNQLPKPLSESIQICIGGINRLLQILDLQKKKGVGALSSDQRILMRDTIQLVIGVDQALIQAQRGPKP